MRKEYYITDFGLTPDAKPEFVVIYQHLAAQARSISNNSPPYLNGYAYASKKKVEKMFGTSTVKKACDAMEAEDLNWIAWDKDGRVEITDCGGYSSSEHYK